MTAYTNQALHRKYIIAMPIVVGIHYYTQLWELLFCIEWWYLIFNTIAIFFLLLLMRSNYITTNMVPINPERAGIIVGQLETLQNPWTWGVYAVNISVGAYMYYTGLILAPLIIASSFSLAMINGLTLKPYLKTISQKLAV